ncbi:MAG: UDP-3-O-(3-hydroxymyristoyl)glucosamine N-acyltransferase [Planctomycetes bacterium]|nr:UDP-3-O-(3-hydroxymyristoyl)glucosamine N-acyltransferase [Planctomycetota bacterium]
MVSAICLRELALLVRGHLEGDGTVVISGATTIDRAQAGEITLADAPGLAKKLVASQASAVVVGAEFPATTIPRIVVPDVHEAFVTIVSHFRPQRQRASVGISPDARIDPTARLADNVEIHPLATIGPDVEIGAGAVVHAGAHIMAGCRIGEDVVLFPGVVLYEDCVIGARSIIHAGCVIGAYGFGYQTKQGVHRRVAQLGNVEIGADVEIGACTTIDRGTYAATTIGNGTKIDNLVMVGHNCRIGRHNLICSQVGVAGSCTTGDYVVMAGQVGLSDHLTIGDRVRLGAQAGIMQDVPDDAAMVGSPATAERDQWRIWIVTRQLPDLKRQVKLLRDELNQLAASERPKDEKQEAA